jgi:hypothetical protein
MPKSIDRPKPQPNAAQKPPRTTEPQPKRELTERQGAQFAFIQQRMGSIQGPRWTDEDLSREKLYD